MFRLRYRAAPAAAWMILGLVAIGVAALSDPLAFGNRALFATILTSLALVVAAISWRAGARVRFVVALALCCWVAWQVAKPRMDLAALLAEPEPSTVGRHFIVGYEDPERIRTLARRGLIGGVFLTRRNVFGRSADAVAAEIASFQEAARAGGFPPLIVAADQEGGPVSHLSPPLPEPPSLASLTDLPASERETAARNLGRLVGASLHRLGFTMDLAPVVDLKPADAPGAFDLHTRIATRAISAEPDIVAAVATSFSRGLLDEGITPVAKYFPVSAASEATRICSMPRTTDPFRRLRMRTGFHMRR